MMINSKFPWIFWINITIRKKWFSYWWSTRGSNFAEFQVWIFKISIGMPWLKCVLKQYLNDRGCLTSVKKTNDLNKKLRFNLQIGKYTNLNGQII